MTTRSRPGLVARLLLGLVHLYQSTAAYRAPRCRFSPTCSAYAVTAISIHGAARGSWLAVRRVLRCHPFHPGGVDEVPGSPTTAGASPTTARTASDGGTVDAAA